MPAYRFPVQCLHGKAAPKAGSSWQHRFGRTRTALILPGAYWLPDATGVFRGLVSWIYPRQRYPMLPLHRSGAGVGILTSGRVKYSGSLSIALRNRRWPPRVGEPWKVSAEAVWLALSPTSATASSIS